MPELPDIAAYSGALEPRIVGQPLKQVRLASAFLLRTVQPPIENTEGRLVGEIRRVGKRIAIGVEGGLWLVPHLMIAGRLHWRPPDAKLAGRQTLAAFDFPGGSLVLTEAGSKRRASLHVVSGDDALRAMDPGGIDIFSSDLESFRTALTSENRTLKRALTDPRLVDGMGAPVGGCAANVGDLGCALTNRGQKSVPREGHCISKGDGGSWTLRRTMSALRR